MTASELLNKTDYLGCPPSQEWCSYTPALTLTQFIISYALTSMGYPTGLALIQSLISKVLGPRPQVREFVLRFHHANFELCVTEEFSWISGYLDGYHGGNRLFGSSFGPCFHKRDLHEVRNDLDIFTHYRISISNCFLAAVLQQQNKQGNSNAHQKECRQWQGIEKPQFGPTWVIAVSLPGKLLSWKQWNDFPRKNYQNFK